MGTVVDCSNHQLTRVPANLPPDTVELLLSGNSITTVSRTDLDGCFAMMKIDLSRNALKVLANDSLVSMRRLDVLLLNDNRLNFSAFSSNLFRLLENLEELRMDNNQWINSSSYNDELFRWLRNLRDLSIDGIPDAEFGKGFSGLTKLNRLTIRGGLNVITNKTFAIFLTIPVKELVIRTGTHLGNLDAMSFAHFHQLEALDLGYNKGLGLGDNVSQAWYGLQYTTIRELVLTRISPVVSPKLSADFFSFLNRTNITRLLINKNNIIEYDPQLSVHLPHLTFLDLSYNRITKVEHVINDLWKLKKIRYLDFSHQDKRFREDLPYENSLISNQKRSFGNEVGNLRQMPRNIEEGTNGALHANASDVWFSQCFTPPLKPCPSVVGVDGVLLEYHTWCIPAPPRLQIINLTQSINSEISDMPAMVLFGGRNMKSMIYRQNGFRKLGGPVIITQPTNELKLDLSDNVISCASPDMFKVSFELGVLASELDVSRNNLAEQLKIDTDGRTFRYFRNLSVLHLSRNEITTLSPAIFSQLGMLETLNLSRNFLRQLEFEFIHMMRLKVMDVSHNLLTNIEDAVLTTFLRHASGLPNGTTFLFNLYGNPIECSCSSLRFLHWMQDKQRNVGRFSTTTRASSVAQLCLLLTSTTSFLRDLDFRCSHAACSHHRWDVARPGSRPI